VSPTENACLGVPNEGDANGELALHAAGERLGQRAALVLQVEDPQDVVDLLRALGGWVPLQLPDRGEGGLSLPAGVSESGKAFPPCQPPAAKPHHKPSSTPRQGSRKAQRWAPAQPCRSWHSWCGGFCRAMLPATLHSSISQAGSSCLQVMLKEEARAVCL